MPTLSLAERAILINQFEIRKALSKDEQAFERVIEVLSSGYKLEYEMFIDGMTDSLSESDCDYVQSILHLYYIMKLSINDELLKSPRLEGEPDGRGRLEKLEPVFPGFDGNGEAKILGYAEFLVHRNGQFSEHKHNLNSHGYHPDYRAMLAHWKSMGKPYKMTPEQVAELLQN